MTYHPLILAAETALEGYKELHDAHSPERCPGAGNCPHASAIQSLKDEIATAKMQGGFVDVEFQAVHLTPEHPMARSLHVQALSDSITRELP